MSKDAFSYATENGSKSYINYTCEDCRFYQQAPDSDAYGECYYWPPRTIVSNGHKQIDTPIVLSQRHICGKFARKYMELH